MYMSSCIPPPNSPQKSFLFQAEDGIRDLYVTGVQTCALPICRHLGVALVGAIAEPHEAADAQARVEEVVVGAFVEVRLAGVRVHEVVGVEESQLGVAHFPIFRGRRSAVAPPAPDVRGRVGLRTTGAGGATADRRAWRR